MIEYAAIAPQFLDALYAKAAVFWNSAGERCCIAMAAAVHYEVSRHSGPVSFLERP